MDPLSGWFYQVGVFYQIPALKTCDLTFLTLEFYQADKLGPGDHLNLASLAHTDLLILVHNEILHWPKAMAMAHGHGPRPWPKAMAQGHGSRPWPKAMA